jgi:hypothetical protein
LFRADAAPRGGDDAQQHTPQLVRLQQQDGLRRPALLLRLGLLTTYQQGLHFSLDLLESSSRRLQGLLLLMGLLLLLLLLLVLLL